MRFRSFQLSVMGCCSLIMGNAINFVSGYGIADESATTSTGYGVERVRIGLQVTYYVVVIVSPFAKQDIFKHGLCEEDPKACSPPVDSTNTFSMILMSFTNVPDSYSLVKETWRQ